MEFFSCLLGFDGILTRSENKHLVESIHHHYKILFPLFFPGKPPNNSMVILSYVLEGRDNGVYNTNKELLGLIIMQSVNVLAWNWILGLSKVTNKGTIVV